MGHLSMPTASADARTCRSWCTGHDPGAPELCIGPTEHVPASAVYPADSVTLTHTPDTGTVIAIGGMYVPVAQAKAFTLALLRQIERAGADEPRPLGRVA